MYYYNLIRDKDLRNIIKTQLIAMWVPIFGGVFSIIVMQFLLFKRASEKAVAFDSVIIIAVILLIVFFFILRSMISPFTATIFYLAAFAFFLYPSAYYSIMIETKILFELQEEDRKNMVLVGPDVEATDYVPEGESADDSANAKKVKDTAAGDTEKIKKKPKERTSFKAFFAALLLKVKGIFVKDKKPIDVPAHEDGILTAVTEYLTVEKRAALREAGVKVDISLFWMISAGGGKRTEIHHTRPQLIERYSCYFLLSADKDGKQTETNFKLSEIFYGYLNSPKVYDRKNNIIDAIEKYLIKETEEE